MDKELLVSLSKKDFEVTFFSGTGAGGQHRNKHMNCVRIRHPITGVVSTGQAERSLEQNKKEAFRNLVNNPKFMAWLKIESAKAALTNEQKRELEREIQAIVEKAMNEKNLLVEEFDGKKWVKLNG